MSDARTQVAIIGAGPAGLLLGHLLLDAGIDCVILERQTRSHVESRIRAGVLEQGTVDTLTDAGLADRLHKEGLIHEGLELSFDGNRHRIDLKHLSDGKVVTVYGQHEVLHDLIEAFIQRGGRLEFAANVSSLEDLAGGAPRVQYKQAEVSTSIQCDFIAGCDGFRGISRASIPDSEKCELDRVYPFGWLGILAKAKPASHELIYTLHERGFSLLSMRSENLCRYYLQCRPDEKLEDWSDERIWEELHLRNAIDDTSWKLSEGPISERLVAAMRSFVVEPMRFGKLFSRWRLCTHCSPNWRQGHESRGSRCKGSFCGPG